MGTLTPQQRTTHEAGLVVASLHRFAIAALGHDFDHGLAHRLLGKVYDVPSTEDRARAAGESWEVIEAQKRIDAGNAAMFEALRAFVRVGQKTVEELA